MRCDGLARLVGSSAVCLVALTGCLAGGGVPSTAGSISESASAGVPFEVYLSPADDGRTQEVLLGGKVILDLPGASVWEYDEPADYPDPALASYCPRANGSGREVFEAVRTGTTTLAYVADRGADRFDIVVEIVDGPGAAPPSSQSAGVLLRARDAGSTVHVPRNGVLMVELPGRGSITNPDAVAPASGGILKSYCVLEPQLIDSQWWSTMKVTAIQEGSADLVVQYRDPVSAQPGALETVQVTVVVDPASNAGEVTPSPSGSSTGGAPFVLELSERDAGQTREVLMGGKAIVTLPDPDGDDASWVVMGESAIGAQLSWSCGGMRDAWAQPAEGPLVFEVGALLGTVPLELVYTPDDEGWPSEWEIRDTFSVTVRIVDGPGAALPTAQIEGVAAGPEDDGSTVEVARNGAVGITVYGQHGLGREWALVRAGEQLEAFCPPQVLSEGPGPKDMTWINQFTFTAMAPGTAEIKLTYRDSDDPDARPLDTYRLTVRIR